MLSCFTSTLSSFLAVDCQLLHAVFSAEAFLHELKRRGAVFQVAFFACTYPIHPSLPRPLKDRICSQSVFRNCSKPFSLVDRIKNTRK